MIPYSYTYAYVINSINMAASHKTLTTYILYSRKAINLLRLLYKVGAIQNYFIVWKNNKKFIKIFINYYKNTPLSKHFKLISSPSRTLFISYNALKVLQKRTYSSVYFLSTSIGLISHHQALKFKAGGILIGFIFN